MNVEHLVTMANQIGTFFDSQGPHAEAVANIADHLRRFWEPRMLQAIGAQLEEQRPHMLPSVAEAVAQLRQGATA